LNRCYDTNFWVYFIVVTELTNMTGLKGVYPPKSEDIHFEQKKTKKEL
jgi:hypothetical protein